MPTPVLRRRPLAIVARALLSSAVVPFAVGFVSPAFAQSTAAATSASDATATDSTKQQSALPAVTVSATTTTAAVDQTYSGGQMSKGADFGVLGKQKIIDVPFAVTSYTEKMMEDTQARTLADVLANDPNVRTAMGYGNFAQTYTIRGFELAGDDLSLNGLYGLTPRQIVSTDALGRVDLFQGTSAFLNGVSPTGTSIGGGINLQLKQADDKPITRVTTELSGSGEIGAHVDVSRRFGSNDQFGIRLNESAGGGDNAIDRQSGRTGTTAVSLDWRGDKLRLTADFLYQLQKVEAGRSIFYDYGTTVPSVPSATSNYAQPWSGSTMEDTVGMLGAEYDFAPGWTAYAKGGIRHTNEHGEYASPIYYSDSNVQEDRLGVPYKQEGRSAAVGIRGKFDTGPVSHQVNVGASIVSEETASAWTLSSTYATTLANSPTIAYPADAYSAGNQADPNRTAETVNKGLSISDTLGFFNDRVLFTIGARRQSISEQGYDNTSGAQTSTYDSSITTPLFGIVFKLTPTLSLYANRSEALVAGDIAPSTASNYGQVFAPYRSKQIETGLKYDAGSYGGNFALFQIKKPSAFTNSSGYYSEGGEQRNQGAELSLYAEPIHGLRVRAGASFTQATLVSTSTASDNGNTAIGVPKWLANIGLEYDVPQVHGLTVTANWTYTSPQYLDSANTMQIGAWSRFDIGARYATQILRHDVTFRATVLNVANRAYWSSTYDGYLTMGDPRTLLLSMTTDF